MYFDAENDARLVDELDDTAVVVVLPSRQVRRDLDERVEWETASYVASRMRLNPSAGSQQRLWATQQQGGS